MVASNHSRPGHFGRPFDPMRIVGSAYLQMPRAQLSRAYEGTRETRGLGRVCRAVDDARGTLIVEQHSFKGPFRWWWTSEDIYRECPVPIAEWIKSTPNDERYRSLAEWCHSKYTSTKTGRARLVEDVPAAEISFLGSAPDWFPERFGFLKVAPPDRLHRYQTVEE